LDLTGKILLEKAIMISAGCPVFFTNKISIGISQANEVHE
jgi:hypothetical protein